MLQSDVSHRAKLLRRLSQVFGASWNLKILSRNQQISFVLWRSAMLLLNVILNCYFFVKYTYSYFKILVNYQENEFKLTSVLNILDSVNQLFYNIILHILMMRSNGKILKTFFDRLEPTYQKLNGLTLNRISMFSYSVIAWLVFSVS